MITKEILPFKQGFTPNPASAAKSRERNRDAIRAKQKQFRLDNPDYDKTAAKKYRVRNKETVRFTKVKTTYGLSKKDYLALLAKQNNRCAICKTDTPRGRGNWHVDHCHKTSKVRGLLCHTCNVSLGGFKDSAEILTAALTYVLGEINMAQINFDASQVDPRQSEGGICLPLADYPVEIVKIEQEAVKDNPNKGFLKVSLKVLDGQYANQIQHDRLNIYGQDETPTRIGYQRLSAYCHIAGKLRVADTNELIGTKLIATCGPQNPPNDKYSEVKVVKDIAGNTPVFGQPSAPQPGPGQAASFAATAPAASATPTQAASPWNNPAQGGGAPAPAASGGTPWATGGAAATPAASTGGAAAPPWAK